MLFPVSLVSASLDSSDRAVVVVAEAGPALRTGVIATSSAATSRLARSFIDVPMAADPARTSMRTTPGTRPDTGQPTDDSTVKVVGNGRTWIARTRKLHSRRPLY